MRGKLNLRFLALVLGGIAVFAVGWFVVHRFQKGRRLGDYQTQAMRAEQEKNFDRAARLLRAYVLAVPSDTDALAHYGEILEKLARTPAAKRDALDAYGKVLGKDPTRHATRRRAAELAVFLELYATAEPHLVELRKAAPNDPRVWFLSGYCSQKMGKFKDAESAYKSAAELATGSPGAYMIPLHRDSAGDKSTAEFDTRSSIETRVTDPYVRRATVLRQLAQNFDPELRDRNLKDEADGVMNALAEALPNSAEAHLACAVYLTANPRIDPKYRGLLTPEKHLAKARECAPDEIEVLYASAQSAVLGYLKRWNKPGADPAALSRDWERARAYLERGIETSPKDARSYLLLARMELWKERRPEAIKILESARTKVPLPGPNPPRLNLIHVLLKLSEQYAEAADKDGANDVLDQLTKLGAEQAQIDFRRALTLVRCGSWSEGRLLLEHVRPLLAFREEAEAQSAAPGGDVDRRDPEVREMAFRIELLLAECYKQQGDAEHQLLASSRAVAAAPLDYRPRLAFAAALVDQGRIDQAIAEYQLVTRMEDSPPTAQLKLARLLVSRNLALSPEQRRWGPVAELLDAVRNRVESPLSAAWVGLAQTAVDLDPARPDVQRLGDAAAGLVRAVVRVTRDEAKFTLEVFDTLSDIERHEPLPAELQRIDADVKLRLDVDRAILRARKAIGTDSKDYKERLWFGRFLSAAGHPAEAETEFEAAVAYRPDKPEVWVAFVQHSARRVGQSGREAEALDRVGAVLARAAAALADGEPEQAWERQLALAQCYDLGGRRDEAEKWFLAALKAAAPKNPQPEPRVRALHAIADFYQRIARQELAEGKATVAPEKAVPHLRALMETPNVPPDEAVWARCSLALALGVNADKLDEALDLVRGQKADELRTRAFILINRPDRRKDVIALLELAERKDADTAKPLVPQNEYRLAELYDADGQWPKARERMRSLVERQPSNPEYLSGYARSLIRRDELEEAQIRVGQLAKIPRHAQTQTTVALQVALWCRLGRPEATVALIRDYAEAPDGTPTDPASRAKAAADLFDRAAAAGAGPDALAAAEPLYKKYKDLVKRPDAVLELASFYGRNDMPDKALAQCEEALGYKDCPFELVVRASLTATSGRSATGVHFAKVEEWLNRAMAEKKAGANYLRYLLGTLREKQGRFKEAEEEYRAVLSAESPRPHVYALNNLAILQALSGRGTEAVGTANRAIGKTTPVPANLLDTRAVAYIAANDLDAAKRDLEAATAGDGRADAYFHLAVVYEKLKDKEKATAEKLKYQEKAVANLHRAHCAGLRPSALHPLERATYDRLVKELK